MRRNVAEASLLGEDEDDDEDEDEDEDVVEFAVVEAWASMLI